MAGGLISWTHSLADMAGDVNEYAGDLADATLEIGESEAQAISDDAKATHKWQNRTGEAEAGIYGTCERLGDAGFVIRVGGSAPHTIYLERRWGGRYAGITPALQRGAPRVVSRVRGLFG